MGIISLLTEDPTLTSRPLYIDEEADVLFLRQYKTSHIKLLSAAALLVSVTIYRQRFYQHLVGQLSPVFHLKINRFVLILVLCSRK